MRLRARSTGASSRELRTPAAQRELIDRVSPLQGKRRTEVMLEAAREKSQPVLLDQTRFTTRPRQHKAFVALMAARLTRELQLMP